jgi:hypothetical protein
VTDISTIFVDPLTMNGVEPLPAGLEAEVIVAEIEMPCEPKVRLGLPKAGAGIATLVAPAGIVTEAVSLEIRLTCATGTATVLDAGAGAGAGAGGATYLSVVTESDGIETLDVPSAVVAVTINEYVVSSERLSIVKFNSPQV